MSIVEAILGLLLLFAWVQNIAIRAVAWWGFAHLIRAASIVLFGMYGSVPRSGQRAAVYRLRGDLDGRARFDGRPAEPVYLVTGAVFWLLVCRLPVLFRRLRGARVDRVRHHHRLYVVDRL